MTGHHRRHGQLLPLEAYLEEGIPLVLALREGPPEMVELPEQSMHAFITWANITSPHPAIKVLILTSQCDTQTAFLGFCGLYNSCRRMDACALQYAGLPYCEGDKHTLQKDLHTAN